MRIVALLIALTLAAPALAQDAVPAVSAALDPTGARLQELLPARSLRRMQDTPDRVLRDAASLVYGHGTNGGIDAAGIDRAVAIARADARGRVLGVILRADLDADGALAGDEAAAIDATAALRDRGRMRLVLRTADADGDGAASAAELSAHATREAAQVFSDRDAENLTTLLQLDFDSDGRVTLDEVASALQSVVQPPAD